MLRYVGTWTLVAGALACTPQEVAEPRDSIEAAETAYFQFDRARASVILDRIVADEAAAPEDRVEALRLLARSAVLFDRDVDEARRLLTIADGIGASRTEILLERSRTEREGGSFEAARHAASRAAEEATSASGRHDAFTEFGRSTLGEAAKQIDQGLETALDQSLLSDASDKLDTVLLARSGELVPSYVGLQLSLLLRDGPRALEAWRSYFRIAPASTPSGLLADPGRALERVLPLWRGGSLGAADLSDVIVALGQSKMFGAASLLAQLDGHRRHQGPAVQEILAYRRYLSAVVLSTEAYYRAAAAGSGNKTAFQSQLLDEAQVLWPLLNWPADPPVFSSAAFRRELDQRFGTELNFQNANGHFGLHMGHRVIDETYRIQQYGREAELRFVSLDFMTSNGFSSWFWDGRAQVGGWAENPLIIQVRPAYAGAGVRAWEGVSDPARRAEAHAEIADLESVDYELAKSNPYGYLPGLARRIELQARQNLLDDLAATGLDSTTLRLAFVAEIERIDLEASIVAHEGRHAIESRSAFNFLRPGSEREFLAKLSEVALSSAPFLAIGGGILSRNIGDGTSHGQANERIMEGLVEWIAGNAERVRGLDVTLPLLPQLDLLTEDQLREAFRAMDPLAVP